MERTEVLILGGGIAGLATALPLARAGTRTLLLEREPTLASHSSGRNAAIWLPAEDNATTPALAQRSVELLNGLLGAAPGDWLRRSGALLVSEKATLLDASARGARRSGLRAERVDAEGAARHAPALAGGITRAGLWLPEAGVLDIHAITEGLARAARQAGAGIWTGRAVAGVVTRSGRVEGVRLEDGTRLAADRVVIAAGAWSASLGASCAAPLPLRPLRRHLVQLEPAHPALVQSPLVWAVGDDVYFRSESGGLLASPCDEEPAAPGLPETCPAALESLARKLRALAPPLAGSRVRRAWACLRTFAPDRELVAGFDPRCEGLVWLAGLGGRGMMIGVAAGELAARLVLGGEDPLAGLVSPARLL